MSRADASRVRREILLEVARKNFWHRGYDEVTIRQIADEAGCSTGAVFSNWKDKAALYETATGNKPPDVLAFLLKVADADFAGADELEALALEAGRLRRQLVGDSS
jgi:AcrR family transcriptional regulator